MNAMYVFFHGGVYDPMAAARQWIWLPVLLWTLVLLSHALPVLVSELCGLLRQRGLLPTLFAVLVIVACVYAYPSSAAKGGGTNEPPVITPAAVPSAVINLYHEGPDGRLYPIGVPIQEVNP